MVYIKLRIQKKARDFPGGPVIGNLPFNLGSVPGQVTKITHAPGNYAHTPQWKISHAVTKTWYGQINKLF